MWTVVNYIGCGMKIRADDPAAMKNFILNVQNRVNELKVSSGDGQENLISKRVTLCNLSFIMKRVLIIISFSFCI